MQLRGHEIMDTAPEPAFERIARIAARFFAMPMAAVTFVDEYRVWCKAGYGLPEGETARENSICGHAISQKDVLVVPDTLLDTRFKRVAYVAVADRSVRFYAGAPLRTAEGYALGMLCVMDTSPRQFTAEDEDTLKDMAAVIMSELGLRQVTRHLRDEIGRRGEAQRMLARQHRLLERLSDSLEDRIRLRTAELARVNDSLRAEIACRERADTAVQQAKAQAEQANAAKSEFLARMSHELRTPLNAILGFGQILRGPVSADVQRDCAGHVVTAGRHLMSLVNEVLDIACIEAGRVELSLEPVRVSEVVAEALELIGPLAAERRITVDVRSGAKSTHVVRADRQRLRQVLLNLLSNAFKYSPAGERIVVACRAATAGTWRLSVADRGPGVAPEQVERLFVAFDRLGAERTQIPGTGLGLALSKRLVEAMGGTIGCRSVPGEGSTFWVCLPAAQATVPAVRDTDPSDDHDGRASGETICTALLIAQHAADAQRIERVLGSCAELNLLTARRVEEALAIVGRQRPDVILLDLHPSDPSGWETLARLRNDGTTRHVPVIVLSAEACADTVERVIRAGALIFRTKPLDADNLGWFLRETARGAQIPFFHPQP